MTLKEEVHGLALEAEPDMGIHRGRDADVGVAQQLLDHNEFNATAPPTTCCCGTPTETIGQFAWQTARAVSRFCRRRSVS